MARTNNEDRARRTLYVTGFDSKRASKDLLKELFTQGGPVVDITMFDTHAYVLFQHQESVPYCLALFNNIELHDKKLRLSPKFKTKDTYSYLEYLAKVRDELRDQYMRQTPPQLPPKIYPKCRGDTYRSGKGQESRRKDCNGGRTDSSRKNRGKSNASPRGQKKSEQPRNKYRSRGNHRR